MVGIRVKRDRGEGEERSKRVLTLWCWPGGGNMAGGEARNTQQEPDSGEMVLQLYTPASFHPKCIQ